MSKWKLVFGLVLSIAAGPVYAQGVQAPGAAMEAARSSAFREDDQRKSGPSRDFGSSPIKNMTIENGGIALPKGLVLTVAACACVGRENQGCVEPDPVACRMHQTRQDGSPDVTRPMDVRLEGAGVEVPRCFGESRESVDCKN